MPQRSRIDQHRPTSGRPRRNRAEAPDTHPLILLADPCRDDRKMYGQCLRFAGYEVAEAADSEETVSLARKLRPAAIIMELAPPGVDVRETTRRLKADAITKDTPLLILSAHAMKGVATWALFDAGAESFLAKPCLPDELLAQVHRVLNADRHFA